MGQRFATVSSKGQVTIPAEIRRLLGVIPRDRIAFVVQGEEVRLERMRGSIVERTAGALKSSQPPQTAEELRIGAEEAIAQEVIRRGSA